MRITDGVERPPYAATVSAGGSSIHQKGVGCGVCYQVFIFNLF